MIRTVWASIKYQYKEFSARFGLFLSRLHFWHWERFSFVLSEENTTEIHYVGRKTQLAVLKSLLGNPSAGFVPETKDGSNRAVVYEVPLPNTLCVPHCLSTVVKLDKSVEEILSTYSRSLRRSILKKLPDFHYETLADESQLQMVNQTMLEPYAIARNGVGAHQLSFDHVKGIAFSYYGRLDLLYEKDKLVGCHLGHSFVRRGKKYWQANRFGYIEEVFSNYKHYQTANSMNLHLALLSATENGYDYCDYGMSLARPDGGLLEWKRRRKGFLTKADGHCFYLKPPKKGSAQFFWDAPLFILEGRKVTLHLGIPSNKTDEEIIERYKEMGYDGIQKVYLKCASPANEKVLEAFEKLYANLSFSPKIIVSNVA